jgi:dTDP-4-amino-4,6-dideoxygalactose transaminase
MNRELPSAASSNLPRATDITNRVICLPIYQDLGDEWVDFVASLKKVCGS